ncbi:MAG TPA: A/G-specific adenine glycosylase [Terriglobales bacterium]|nr:A/G-specific adenine glycosylase [Terriglobales bacterium]
MLCDTQVSVRRLPQFRKSLLAWYDANRRDLPWRRTRDPYRIWISEIMLQQTRVAAVLPRYERFLEEFPSVEKLAAAKLDAVLAEWSGLGYYHRARNLRAAAKVIVNQHRGKFPRGAASLLQLPGIGRYTAAAIASIAFNEPVAVLDGNVERVLSRLFGVAYTKAKSWVAAQHLIDHTRPGDFNQSMMELGATVCVPHEPACPDCPIRKFCQTRGRGKFHSPKPRQMQASVAYGLETQQDSVLLVKRSSCESLMPGMWELPRLEATSGGKLIFTVRHSITVTDYRVAVVECDIRHPKAKRVRVSQLRELPLTGLTQKILRKAKIIR